MKKNQQQQQQQTKNKQRKQTYITKAGNTCDKKKAEYKSDHHLTLLLSLSSWRYII